MKVGVDIGGSHLAMAIISDDYKIVSKKEINLPQKKDNIKEYIVRIIKDAVLSINKNISIIGICSCGTIKNGEIVKSDNLEIYNFNLVKRLREELKYSEKINTPIVLRNDTKCAAMAEKKLGSLKDYDDALFLTVGTGIGGAYLYNGKLVEPKRFPGFEVGHMITHRDGRFCSCGNVGCFEAYGSITALKLRIMNAYKMPERPTGEELIKIIRQTRLLEKEQSNQKMDKILTEYVLELTLGISNLINILEPEIVAIGGSFAYYEDLFLHRIENQLKIFNNFSEPKIVCATLKNDAGLLGAVMP